MKPLPNKGWTKLCGVFWLSLFFCLLSVASVFAEILPVKTYTTADGLLRDEVRVMKQDSRGFLWFCMQGGLSRYDGYSFTNYTMDDGLPSPSVNDLIEAHDGTIWLTSNEGLIKFNPRGMRQKFDKNNPANPDSMFQVYVPDAETSLKVLHSIVELESGLLFAIHEKGLVKIETKNGLPVFRKTEFTENSLSLAKDSKGNLWIGTWEKGLFLIQPDGKTSQFTSEHGLPKYLKYPSIAINDLFEDKDKRIWLGGRSAGGICRLVENPQPNQTIVDGCYTDDDGLSSDWVTSIGQTSDGTLWISTVQKLTQMNGFDKDGKPVFRVLDSNNGITDKATDAVLEDRDGNVWVATTEGVKKISRQGFTRYDVKDGLATTTNFGSIFETNEGELIVTDHPNERNVNVFRNGQFIAVKPNYTPEIDYWGWGGKHAVLQTRNGEWWMITGSSPAFQNKYGLKHPNSPILIRFPSVRNPEDLARTRPLKIYHTADVPNVMQTFQIYEDRNQDIWIMAFGDAAFLYRWDRKTDKFVDYSESLDLKANFFQTFAEDESGNLWIGGSVSRKSNPNEIIRLLRYRDGGFQVIQIRENFQGAIYDLLVDGENRLWAATSRDGLLLLEDVNAENPSFKSYGTAQGLSDNQILTVAADKLGRIYAGSGRGVDRLNVQTGEVRHFTTNDGLPGGGIYLSKSDKTGAIWFGSLTGIARFVPEPDKSRQTPNVYISGLRVAGVPQTISELGEVVVPSLEFTAEKNNLTIDYLGLGASLGEKLKYQYKLGSETSEWISTNERTLNFANLSAGDYQFAVRAVTSDGLISQQSATFSFSVLRPIYLRWWFLSLVAILFGAAIYQLYRLRVRRLLEIERTRTRIATDLHDDIGSDLSKISLLSEVIRLQMTNGNEANNLLLTKIAETSRKSVDSMRDIVWAINPTRDSLSDLVHKMRGFAEETLVERNISLTFDAPIDHQNFKLSMDTRRELYLIFKEAVSNAAKHSACSRVKIDFEVIGKDISLKIGDNGNGFDATLDFEGNGLNNMKRRAENLGGKFFINFHNGTVIHVLVPQKS